MSHVVHDADMAPLHSLLQIRILKHDAGTLAAALERDVLEVVGRRLHDGPPRRRAPREGDLVDAHVARESLARHGAQARDDVDDAGGQAGLDDEVAEVDC